MEHARKQIRGAVAGILASLPTTGARAFQARGSELTPDERPGLVITIPNEAVEVTAADDRGAIETRVAELVVLAYVEGADAETTLEQIALEVEPALLAGKANLGGRVDKVVATGSRTIIDDGEQPNGEVRLGFLVAYRTVQGVPGVIIPPG